MAFKRSSVRSRPSPPKKRQQTKKFAVFYLFCKTTRRERTEQSMPSGFADRQSEADIKCERVAKQPNEASEAKLVHAERFADRQSEADIKMRKAWQRQANEAKLRSRPSPPRRRGLRIVRDDFSFEKSSPHALRRLPSYGARNSLLAFASRNFDRCANKSSLHLPQAAVGCVAPFRKKSHSSRLLGCKRPRNGFVSLPTFCGFCAYGALLI